jgi:hypothetical protein
VARALSAAVRSRHCGEGSERRWPRRRCPRAKRGCAGLTDDGRTGCTAGASKATAAPAYRGFLGPTTPIMGTGNYRLSCKWAVGPITLRLGRHTRSEGPKPRQQPCPQVRTEVHPPVHDCGPAQLEQFREKWDLLQPGYLSRARSSQRGSTAQSRRRRRRQR